VVSVSDSGEAEASIVFERQRFSLIRGFAQSSLRARIDFANKEIKGIIVRKNHLQKPRGFWLLFAGTKSNRR
jgi:hypothetical protein